MDGGDRNGIEEKHKIMRRLGNELGIETFSMHDFLRKDEIRRSGQIWWDYVHLSSYGQALVADWLLPKVSAALSGSDDSMQAQGIGSTQLP